MKLRSIFALAAVVMAGVFSVVSINAQGVIVPMPCDFRPCRPRPVPVPLPNALPVKSIELTTKIEGQVATTHVEQVFRNDTQYTLEGTYFFPIPFAYVRFGRPNFPIERGTYFVDGPYYVVGRVTLFFF